MAKRKSSSKRKTTGAKKAKVRSARKRGTSGARSITTPKAKRKAKAAAPKAKRKAKATVPKAKRKAKATAKPKAKVTAKAKARTKVKAKAKARAKVRAKTRTSSRAGGSSRSRAKAKATRSAPARGRAKGTTARSKPAASSTTASSPRRKPSTSHPKPPRKRAGLSDEDLAIFRELLLEKRAELAGDVHNMRREALRRNDHNGEGESSAVRTHMADVGSDNWEQEFTLGLLDKDVALLREIDDALERIESGAYGRCLATERRITKQRLRAKPWAKYCIDYVRQVELGQVP